MKVILLENVKGKGKKDDVIEVSAGYGNNYLIKNKLAVLYTSGSKKILDNELEIRKQEEDELVNKYLAVKERLENKEIKFKVKTGTMDKVFGHVSSKQIVDKLKENGIDIDKKCIKIDANIDTLGTHKVLIELHKKVKFYINVVVIK